jgi:membrane protein involved in colicin uptake
MFSPNDRGFQDRLTAAAAAKKALLEKAKAKLNADDPATLERRAAREAIIKARNERLAAKEAERLAAEAARKAEQERIAAEKAAREAAEKAEREARAAALEAERQAKREAQIAARKGRKVRDLSWLTGGASQDA